MMRRRIDDVALRDVALWRIRTGHSLPVPLSGGAVDDVELTVEERLDASERRLAVHGDVPRQESPLVAAAPLLTAPQWGVWAGRVGGGAGRSLLVVGLVRGEDALLVTEQRASWQLQRVPATAVVEALVTQLPPLRPAPLDPVELSGRSLEEVRQRTGRTGSPGEYLSSRGVDAATAALLERVDAGATASGLLGAMAFGDDGDALPVEEEVRWFESQAGSVISSTGADGRTRVMPASAAGLRLVVGRLADDARRRMTRRIGATTTGVGAR